MYLPLAQTSCMYIADNPHKPARTKRHACTQGERAGEKRPRRAPCQLRSLLRLLRKELKIMSAAAGANTAIDSPAILALWMFCAPRAARQRQACRQQRR